MYSKDLLTLFNEQPILEEQKPEQTFGSYYKFCVTKSSDVVKHLKTEIVKYAAQGARLSVLISKEQRELMFTTAVNTIAEKYPNMFQERPLSNFSTLSQSFDLDPFYGFVRKIEHFETKNQLEVFFQYPNSGSCADLNNEENFQNLIFALKVDLLLRKITETDSLEVKEYELNKIHNRFNTFTCLITQSSLHDENSSGYKTFTASSMKSTSIVSGKSNRSTKHSLNLKFADNYFFNQAVQEKDQQLEEMKQEMELQLQKKEQEMEEELEELRKKFTKKDEEMQRQLKDLRKQLKKTEQEKEQQLKQKELEKEQQLKQKEQEKEQQLKQKELEKEQQLKQKEQEKEQQLKQKDEEMQRQLKDLRKQLKKTEQEKEQQLKQKEQEMEEGLNAMRKKLKNTEQEKHQQLKKKDQEIEQLKRKVQDMGQILMHAQKTASQK